MAEGKDIPINIKTATDPAGLNQAVDGLQKVQSAAEGAAAGATGVDALDEALARLGASADAAIERIDALDESNAALAPGLADVANKADEAEQAVREAKEAVEEHGEKSEKASEKMLAMGQISQGLSMGLNNLAEVARANGQEELANDLNKVAAAMTLVTSIAATGLHFQTAIVAAGGLQAALVALRATAIASLAAFGPYLAAIAAGAAAYYALQKAADAYMGTVAEMDAKNERAAQAITGVTVSHDEEKSARDRAKAAIQDYTRALQAANDELEKNLELTGNEEALAKARINADVRKKQAEIDAQASLYERTGGKEGLSTEQAITATQQLNEEKLRRFAEAEETRRSKQETILKDQTWDRGGDLNKLRVDHAQNNQSIADIEGRNNLSADERRTLRSKAQEIETARQKYGADSDEVAELMSAYQALAGEMNAEEKEELLQRLTLREELSQQIEKAAKDLEDLKKRLEKTQRENNQERSVSQVEYEGELTTSRIHSSTKIQEERARRDAEAKRTQRGDTEPVVDRKKTSRDDAAAMGRDALGFLPKDVSNNFRNAVQRAAKGLQDGDQGGELAEMAKLMNDLANAVEKRDAKKGLDISNLAARIKQLENRK